MVQVQQALLTMNSSITFPPPVPALKLVRPSAEKWAATLAEERRRLQEDQEALREREANLRDYEARLRALQLEIETGREQTGKLKPIAPGAPVTSLRPATNIPFQRPTSRAPFVDDSVLQTGWEKLHRARELLEAEQTHLRDDRIALREFEANLKRREEAVSLREARVAEQEAMIAACVPAADNSAVARITAAPFKIARAMMRGKKAS